MGTECRSPPEKRAPGAFRKVSKPLMEKKRRARINVSLEQLKALLEKHYSHQIRKRKLEKADILELSVKYMRSLQYSVQGLHPLSPKSADYQAGFRSCLQGVRQFLARSEAAGAASSFLLLQDFARALPAASGAFSTKDSGPAPAALPEARLAAPQWPRQGEARPAKPPRGARLGSEAPVVPSGAARSQARSADVAARSQRGSPSPQARLWRPW